MLAEAPFRTDEAGHPVFDNFGEATLSGCCSCIRNKRLTIIEHNGTYYRLIADYDEQAKTLWNNLGLDDEAYTSFIDYCKTLPVKYDGEFSAAPLEQKDLDKLVGKTLGDVRKEGFRYSHYFNENPDFITFELEKGYFKYGIETDTSFDEYRNNQEQRNHDDLIIKSVNWYGGFSNEAYGPDFNRE